MKWKKFTIQTTTAAEDFISEKLSEIGIEGIEIEDKVELTANDTKGMFIDVLPDLGPDDGEALVSFYLDDTYDVPKTLAAVKMALEEVASFVTVPLFQSCSNFLVTFPEEISIPQSLQ
mgnify:CR=1 FL=1